MKSKIPLLDLQPEITENLDQFVDAFKAVLAGGQFIMGPNVPAFEGEVAELIGVTHAIAVNSGTDALVIALRAAGIGPGDEVITTPFTFFATAEAILACGATPVFVDIDENSFNLDATKVAAAITDRTKAIEPVHLYGHAADMDPILSLAQQHGLFVLEDAAQSFGAKYKGRRVGTLGNACAFSFFPSKNLGAFGDAGMIVINDAALAEKAKILRVHGSKKKYFNEVVGYNSRLDELQAALLRIKLRTLERNNNHRREKAKVYDSLFADVENVVTPPVADYTEHVFHQYTIRVKDGKRDAVADALKVEGIGSFVYYPYPLHKLPAVGQESASFPIAERACEEALSLPIWPTIAASDQERVRDTIKAALTQ